LIPWPSRSYPNWNFWYENVASGNPERNFLFSNLFPVEQVDVGVVVAPELLFHANARLEVVQWTQAVENLVVELSKIELSWKRV
jgi:hypothetical protein